MTRLTTLFVPKLTMSAVALGSALSFQASAAFAQPAGEAPLPATSPGPVPVEPAAPATQPSPAPAAGSPAAPSEADVAPQDAGAAPVAAIPLAEDDEELDHDGKKKKKKKKAKHGHADDANGEHVHGAKGKDKDHARPGEVRTAAGRIRLKGRVLAQAALEHQTTEVLEGGTYVQQSLDTLDLSIDSVRVGLEYQAPMHWLTAVAEMELTGGVSLKDGYVQAREKHWSVRAGQFKMPVSAIEMESPWVLPLVRRGLIHDLLTDWLDVAGRRPGVLVAFRTGDSPRFRLSAGAFQGSIVADDIAPGDRNTDLIKNQGLDAQSLVGRADLEVGPAAFGAWYEHRVGSPLLYQYEHYETFGLDAVIDHHLPAGGVRGWAEVLAGESWYEHPDKVEDDKDAIFVSARAVGAFRFGGTVDEAPYIEPFAFVGMLDPDTDITHDVALEWGVGVSAGFWRRARISLEGEVNNVQRNFPNGYRLEQADPDRLSLLAQAGVAW